MKSSVKSILWSRKKALRRIYPKRLSGPGAWGSESEKVHMSGTKQTGKVLFFMLEQFLHFNFRIMIPVFSLGNVFKLNG